MFVNDGHNAYGGRWMVALWWLNVMVLSARYFACISMFLSAINEICAMLIILLATTLKLL